MLLQTLIDKNVSQKLFELASERFWEKGDFWINFVVGLLAFIVGLFAWIEAAKAFKEAKRATAEASKAFDEAERATSAATAAKDAAREASKVVKIQTITIELTELTLRLDKLSTEFKYSDARDFYSEINRKVRRCISSLSSDQTYTQITQEILATLTKIKSDLDGLRTSDAKDLSLLAGIDIYAAIEGDFSTLSGQLADLCGFLEQKTIG